MVKKISFLILIIFIFYSCKSKYHGLTEKKLNKELLKAVAQENYTLIKTLLKEGADVNASDVYGVTPMTIAVEKQNIKMVRLLAKYDVEFTIENDSTEISGKKLSILVNAIELGNLELVKALIELGADPFETFNYHEVGNVTILMIAAFLKNIEMVKYFIDLGVKINARDHFGDPALSWATSNSEIIKLLIDKGSELNMTGYLGRTTLDHAVNRNPPNEEVINILKEAGAKSANDL